jgi:pimeloyl-ACP methyl ester carboxylesterase
MSILNYKDQGEGPIVVILHGLFGMLDNWHSFAKMLSEDYRVISVDLRNHGRSFHSEVFNYVVMADDLLALAQSLEIPSMHLIGHSMGGKVAAQFASSYPSYVDKLSLIDIAPIAYDRGHDDVFDAVLSLEPTSLNSRKDAEHLLSQSLSDNTVIQFILKSLTRNQNGFEWKTNFQALYDNYDNIRKAPPIKQITIPCLIVRGSRSSYVNKDGIAAAKKWMPDLDVQTLDAGHWVHAERPSELLDIIKTFFTK